MQLPGLGLVGKDTRCPESSIKASILWWNDIMFSKTKCHFEGRRALFLRDCLFYFYFFPEFIWVKNNMILELFLIKLFACINWHLHVQYLYYWCLQWSHHFWANKGHVKCWVTVMWATIHIIERGINWLCWAQDDWDIHLENICLDICGRGHRCFQRWNHEKQLPLYCLFMSIFVHALDIAFIYCL